MFFKSNLKLSSDEELMLLIKRGNEKAFEAIYDRYAKRLHYFFYKMLNKDDDVADDFLQDIFIKLMDKAHLFHPEGKFKTWIYTLATNMVKNEYRRIGNLKTDRLTGYNDIQIFDNEWITSGIDIAIFKEELNKVIDTLDENDKVVFALRYNEELSVKEIAEIMNLPDGTVKSKLFYTLKKIAFKLNGLDPR